MSALTPITMREIEQRYQQWVRQVIAVVTEGEDLTEWGASALTPENLAAGLLTTGQVGPDARLVPLTGDQLTTAQGIYKNAGDFVTFMRKVPASGKSPLQKLQATRRDAGGAGVLP